MKAYLADVYISISYLINMSSSMFFHKKNRLSQKNQTKSGNLIKGHQLSNGWFYHFFHQ